MNSCLVSCLANEVSIMHGIDRMPAALQLQGKGGKIRVKIRAKQ